MSTPETCLDLLDLEGSVSHLHDSDIKVKANATESPFHLLPFSEEVRHKRAEHFLSCLSLPRETAITLIEDDQPRHKTNAGLAAVWYFISKFTVIVIPHEYSVTGERIILHPYSNKLTCVSCGFEKPSSNFMQTKLVFKQGVGLTTSYLDTCNECVGYCPLEPAYVDRNYPKFHDIIGSATPKELMAVFVTPDLRIEELEIEAHSKLYHEKISQSEFDARIAFTREYKLETLYNIWGDAVLYDIVCSREEHFKVDAMLRKNYTVLRTTLEYYNALLEEQYKVLNDVQEEVDEFVEFVNNAISPSFNHEVLQWLDSSSNSNYLKTIETMRSLAMMIYRAFVTVDTMNAKIYPELPLELEPEVVQNWGRLVFDVSLIDVRNAEALKHSLHHYLTMTNIPNITFRVAEFNLAVGYLVHYGLVRFNDNRLSIIRPPKNWEHVVEDNPFTKEVARRIDGKHKLYFKNENDQFLNYVIPPDIEGKPYHEARLAGFSLLQALPDRNEKIHRRRHYTRQVARVLNALWWVHDVIELEYAERLIESNQWAHNLLEEKLYGTYHSIAFKRKRLSRHDSRDDRVQLELPKLHSEYKLNEGVSDTVLYELCKFQLGGIPSQLEQVLRDTYKKKEPNRTFLQTADELGLFMESDEEEDVRYMSADTINKCCETLADLLIIAEEDGLYQVRNVITAEYLEGKGITGVDCFGRFHNEKDQESEQEQEQEQEHEQDDAGLEDQSLVDDFETPVQWEITKMYMEGDTQRNKATEIFVHENEAVMIEGLCIVEMPLSDTMTEYMICHRDTSEVDTVIMLDSFEPVIVETLEQAQRLVFNEGGVT